MSFLRRYEATLLWCAYVAYMMGVVQYYETIR